MASDDEVSDPPIQSFTPGESNFTTQVVTIQNDNSNFSAGIKFDENNYSLWHQVIEMKIDGREKMGIFLVIPSSLKSQTHCITSGELKIAKSKVGYLML
ncbi:hypothetical protein EV2_028341 [Malus domestica]